MQDGRVLCIIELQALSGVWVHDFPRVGLLSFYTSYSEEILVLFSSKFIYVGSDIVFSLSYAFLEHRMRTSVPGKMGFPP